MSLSAADAVGPPADPDELRRVAAGDHELVLLRVHDFGAGGADPLVFSGSRFRTLAEPAGL